MTKETTISNLKLGAFVLAGFAFLVLLLFMLGKNQNLFGNTYVLKASFNNVQGLLAGNNVRFAGIQIGTVKKIKIINDTLIEVTMNIEKRMLPVIKKNAVVSVGTEGLVGNKVVNIVPNKTPAPPAVEGDILVSRKAFDTDEMMNTLSKTNEDISAIAEELRTTVERINGSNSLWTMIDDKTVPENIRLSLENIRQGTIKSLVMVNDLNAIVRDVREGKGSLGAVLKDSLYAYNLNDAILKIRTAGVEADSIALIVKDIVTDLQHGIETGRGPFHAMLKDSTLVEKLDVSLDNIMKGTDGFNQNMEALKHNFLFRGYFKKLEKQRAKKKP